MNAFPTGPSGIDADPENELSRRDGAVRTGQSTDAGVPQVGFVFCCHGVYVGFRTNRPETIDSVLGRLPPGSRLDDEADAEAIFTLIHESEKTLRKNNYSLFFNDKNIAEDLDMQRILELLEDLFRLEVSYWADDEHIFVHAGVVTHAGMAIVLPGRSGSGKTTLVSAMLDAGAQYCSDEMAVIDRAGCVVPFATPLALRRNGRDTKHRLSVDERIVDRTPRRIGLVMMLRYDQALRSFRPRRVTTAQAVIALLDHTVAARRLPKPAMARFSQVCQNAPVFSGRRRDAAATAQWIMRFVESLPAGSPDAR